MKSIGMFLVLLLATAGVIFGDISLTGYTLTPDPIIPGSSGTLNIDLMNTGTSTATVQIDTSSIRPIISDSRITVGDLETSGTVKVALPFRVEPNAQTGIYTMRMVIFGSTVSSSTSSSSNQLKNIILPIKVLNKPLVSIQSPRINLLKESDTVVPIELVNIGGKAVNMKLSINSDSFMQVGNSPLLVGELSNSSKLELGVFVKDSVPSGTNVLPVLLTYQDPLGYNYSDTVNLPVDVKEKKTSFIVQGLTTNAIIGANNELLFSLTNNGDSTAYNVKFKIIGNQDITPLGTSLIDLGDIKKSETVNIPVTVAVSQIAEGYKSLDAEIQYEDNSRNKVTELAHVGLKMSGKLDLTMYVDAKPVPITQGKEHTLSVIVSNAGNSKIRGLEVSIEPDQSIILLDSAKNQFIGSLSEDDFSSVQYRVIPRIGVNSTNIEVRLKYQDVFNNVREETRQVSLKVVPPEYLKDYSNKGNGGEAMIAGVLLVGAVAVWYFFFRKKK